MHINNTDIKKIETWSDQVFEECTQSFSVDAEQQNKIERRKETKKLQKQIIFYVHGNILQHLGNFVPCVSKDMSMGEKTNTRTYQHSCQNETSLPIKSFVTFGSSISNFALYARQQLNYQFNHKKQI